MGTIESFCKTLRCGLADEGISRLGLNKALTAGSPLAGLLSFLRLLAGHPWTQRPLVVDPEGEMDIAQRQACVSSFQKVCCFILITVSQFSVLIHFHPMSQLGMQSGSCGHEVLALKAFHHLVVQNQLAQWRRAPTRSTERL